MELPRFSNITRNARLVLISGLAAALVACGGGSGGDDSGSGGGGGGAPPPPPPPPQTTGTLSVTVTDDAGVAIDRAAVRVTVGTAAPLTATTGPNGTASISNVPTGTATVEASKDLYIPGTASATITASQTTSAPPLRITRRVGQVSASIRDQFAAAIPNAQVRATIEDRTVLGVTAANGTVTLAGVPTGAVTVSTTAAGFAPSVTTNVAVVESQTAPYSAILVRVTQAAGGFVSARIPAGGLSADGRTLDFRIQVIVIDETGQGVQSLTAANFSLNNCANVDPAVVECVRDQFTDADASYVRSTSTATSFALIPGQPRVPYFASLLLDQSRSILDTDPTDARIFATKIFLDDLGTGDVVALSAFASSPASGENPALIPQTPVTQYGFSTDGRSFFDELDLLAVQEGGDTPLYEALNEMIGYSRTNATTQGRAVVLFTDGKDFPTCQPSSAACRAASIALANQDPKVDIFTIGLSDDIDFEAMAELADGANGIFLFAENAEQLIPIYGSLGALLSKSLVSYEMVWRIEADRTGVFQSGRSVLGRMQINTTSNPIELPFVVRIP